MRQAPYMVAVLVVASGTIGCASQARNDGGRFPAHADAPYRSTATARDTESRDRIELDEDSGLESYLAYALEHNAGLEAAFHRWKAALQRIDQVQVLPDPKLSYRYYVREVETRVGAMRQGFALSQTFPWLGTLDLKANAATRAAEAERLRFEAARLALFYEVKDAYFEYYHLRRSIEIVRRNLQLLRRLEQVARTRYKTAAATHPEVIRAQVELGKLTDRIESLRELRSPVMARLNAALGRPVDATIAWPTEIPDQTVNFRDEQLLAWLGESSPRLRAMNAEIQAAGHRIELARKDFYPDVTIGVDYVDVANPVGTMRPRDAGKDAIAVMATINLPVWFEKTKAGVREARHRHWAAKVARRQRAKDLSATLKLVLYRFRDAERKLDLYRNTLVPKAVEAVRTSESAFRSGKASFTDLIDAERVLLAFELAAERALADRAQRLAELEMLVGRELHASTPATQPSSRSKPPTAGNHHELPK